MRVLQSPRAPLGLATGLVVTLAAVGTADPAAEIAGSDATYAAEVDAWHQARTERLLAPDGWLSLAGLYWLEPGETSFGSEPSLPVTLPKGKSPGLAGVFTLEGFQVRVRAWPGTQMQCEGERVDERVLLADSQGGPTILELGPLRLYIIERGGRLAVRVKDLEHPARTSFEGIERYPVDPSWRVTARFEPYDPWKPIEVPDVTGFVNEAECPGALVFNLGGAEQRLDVLSAEDGFFVVFGDETNGKTTYGGGRFLSVDPPDASGAIHVDFNKATNPPCAFTPYATCPLPTEGNRLSLAVEAGERRYGNH